MSREKHEGRCEACAAKAKRRRIGRSMLLALDFVYLNHRCTKFACARAIGAPRDVDPAHSPASMYWTIDRCIALGYLAAELVKERPRVYALTITPSGAALLKERMYEG
jgi:hypothetical protein